jgi:hypothetical protein
MFAGPAFSLSTAVLQNGETYYTFGLILRPSISSDVILLFEFTIFYIMFYLS